MEFILSILEMEETERILTLVVFMEILLMIPLNSNEQGAEKLNSFRLTVHSESGVIFLARSLLR